MSIPNKELVEKFRRIEVEASHNSTVAFTMTEHVATACASIAEEYAREMSVKFSEWIVNEDYIPVWPANDNNGMWRGPDLNKFTTEQLYSLYLLTLKQ